MKHLFRFLASPISGSKQWTITEEEFRHLSKVLRLSIGDEIEMTDGRGTIALGSIVSIEKNHATVEITKTDKIPKPTRPLALAIGALKPGSVDDVLPFLTELGLDEIVVFLQEGDAKVRIAEKVIERWHRILLAAVKQSKRVWIPELKVYNDVITFLDGISGRFDHKLLLDQEAFIAFLDAPCFREETCTEQGGGQGILTLVGSEKGFNEAEISSFKQAGFVPVRFTENVLRACTACIAAAAVMALKRDLTVRLA